MKENLASHSSGTCSVFFGSACTMWKASERGEYLQISCAQKSRKYPNLTVEEERLGRVVRGDDLRRAVGEQLLLVRPVAGEQRGRPVRVPQVGDGLRLVAGPAEAAVLEIAGEGRLRPVGVIVVAVVEVPERGVKAPAERDVVRRSVARVPLAELMRGVAGGLELGADHGHAARHAEVHVADAVAGLLEHVHGEPAAQRRRPRRWSPGFVRD